MAKTKNKQIKKSFPAKIHHESFVCIAPESFIVNSTYRTIWCNIYESLSKFPFWIYKLLEICKSVKRVVTIIGKLVLCLCVISLSQTLIKISLSLVKLYHSCKLWKENSAEQYFPMKAKRFDQSQNVLLVDTNALYSSLASAVVPPIQFWKWGLNTNTASIPDIPEKNYQVLFYHSS